MPKFRSTLTLGFTLINGSVEYYMENGTPVEVTVARPYMDEVISGVIAGCSIRSIKSPNRMGRIFDGIPTQAFCTDAKANIKNAVDTFEVDEILINTAVGEEDPIYREIPVTAIKAISGNFVSPDGSTTITVNPVETPVSQILADIPADATATTTVVLPEAEIAEELTVAAAVAVSGVNAGIAQNFEQEV